MTDILTARIATAKGRARVRLSASERDAVTAQRKASRDALARAVESRNAAHYDRTVTRMQSLLTERQYALEDLAREREKGNAWIVAGTPIGDRLARIDGELDIVFGTPIRQSDVAPGGRYERAIAYHMRRIASRHTIGSMLITGDDARDILSLAIVRAYTDSTLVEDERGNMVPTIGTLYRFGRAELMRTVSRARREVNTVSRDTEWYSERDEMPRNGAASLMGVDPARIDWEDRDAVKAIVTPAPRWSVTPDHADMALAERIERRRANRRKAEALKIASERSQDRASTAESAAYGTDDVLGIDAACVSLIASGSSLEDVAERLSIKRDTLVRRLMSVRFRENGRGVSVIRFGSDGRVKRETVKRAPARDVRTPDERTLIATRKRAPRVARVLNMSDLPIGWQTATTPVHAVHYSPEVIADVRDWTCELCERTASDSQYATLAGHSLAGCKHDAGRSAIVIASPAPQGDPVPMSADERHAAAHNMGRCNCAAA